MASDTPEKDLSASVTFIESDESDLPSTVEIEENDIVIPDDLPILPLRGLVVFPQTAVPLTVGQPRSIRLIDEAVAAERMIGLVSAKDPSLETPGPDDIYTVGTMAEFIACSAPRTARSDCWYKGWRAFALRATPNVNPTSKRPLPLRPKASRKTLKSKR